MVYMKYHSTFTADKHTPSQNTEVHSIQVVAIFFSYSDNMY